MFKLQKIAKSQTQETDHLRDGSCFLPVVITRLKSSLTKLPSLNFNPEGTTVQPRRTPVKPAYFENEFTSIATSFAPSISKMDFGTFSERINGA